MSTDTQIQAPETKPRAMAAMAARFNVEPARLLQTLKDTVFKGASDSEVMALAIVANEWGLNPLTKEIYAFPAKGGGIVPVISIDGWINRVNSHPQYDGMEKEFAAESNGKPISCTVTIYRRDRTRPTRHTEFYHECHRNTEPWNKQPNRMLGHRTFIQCARLAFGFAGADPDDADLSQARIATGREVADPQDSMAAMLAGGKDPEPEPKPTAIEKPNQRAAKRETAPKSEPTVSAYTEILGRLYELGYSQEEFIEAVRHLQITPARQLGEVGISEWDTALGRWNEVRRAMDEQHPVNTADEGRAA